VHNFKDLGFCIQRVEFKKIEHFHFFPEVLKAALINFSSDQNLVESANIFIFFFWDDREKENSRSVIVNQQV